MPKHPDQEPKKLSIPQLRLDSDSLNDLRARCASGYGIFKEAGTYTPDRDELDQEWIADFHTIELNVPANGRALAHKIEILVFADGVVQDVNQRIGERRFTSEYSIQFDETGSGLTYYKFGSGFQFTRIEDMPTGLRLRGVEKVYGYLHQTQEGPEAHLGIFRKGLRLYWTAKISQGQTQLTRFFVGHDERFHYDYPPRRHSRTFFPDQEEERLFAEAATIFEGMEVSFEYGHEELLFAVIYDDQKTIFTLRQPSTRTLDGLISHITHDQEQPTPAPLIVPFSITEKKL